MLPNGRSPPCAAIPLSAAAIPCSRTPQWNGASRARGTEGAALLERGAGTSAQIGRAADQIGHRGRDRLQGEAGGLAGGELPVGGRQHRQAAVPALGQRSREPLLELGGELGMIRGVGATAPARHSASSASPRVDRARASAPAHRPGMKNLGSSRPAHDLLGALDFLGAERRAVRLGGVALGRRGIGDVGPEHDQRRPVGLGRGPPRAPSAMAARSLPSPTFTHVPAVGLEAAPHVLGERERRVAVDGDVVVVVDQGELAEPQVAGERAGLAGDAFHQVAVADDRPGAVIDDPMARAVEVLGRGSARRSPCRRRCRRPGRADRWWSRRPACGRAPDGPA